MSLTQAVKAGARHLGFQLVGVTHPGPPSHFQNYLDWLGDERHGQMAYLATERARLRRADPLQILPECKSILLLGVRYPTPPPVESYPAGKFRGKVASYAWGDDYHDVLPDRLRDVVSFIEEQVGSAISHRWYTDTGPILERDLAQRAGLGWIGKNTCLIHPQQGSYFLLAEILLGVELEPDKPFLADHCGTCSRCLDACPTACILPDRTIDARRCISYLTIELKGTIPIDLRSQMGEWIFGCDICQQVCPWNQRFAAPEADPSFAPRPDLPSPNLLEALNLSAQEFNRKFKGSPLKRAKRRGYLRNVAIALGNSGDERAVPDLARSLKKDPEPLLRGHAAWALGQIGGRTARRALNEALEDEGESSVVEEIQAALKTIFGNRP
jgi:epoxyqueuosine reductase